MRERDIRAALLSHLHHEYRLDYSTRVLNELAVGGGVARIDVAVINGLMLGFEIKSEADTLQRLPAQAMVYSTIFDRITVVCGPRHVGDVSSLIPAWWCIVEARIIDSRLDLLTLREGKENPCVDPLQIARLLWRDEVFSVLNKYDLASRLKSKSREQLMRILCANVALPALKTEVRECLKSRLNWRVGERHASYDGSSQPDATP